MNNYLHYVLHLDEPVKMGLQGNQSNTEALTYLAGSTLRGAFLSACINMYYKDFPGDLSRDQAAGKELFRDTFFYDAYPFVNGRDLMPMPTVYYADKHKVREVKAAGEENRDIPLSVHCRLDTVPAEGEVRIGTGQYCCYEKNTVLSYHVRKEANLHIRIKDEATESTMFRYEAIARGQDFSGLIRCADEETAVRYQKAIDGGTFYLGGSRGSGYGRCRVTETSLKSFEETRAAFEVPRKDRESSFTVYALSNLILLDENGSEAGSIPADILERVLGVRNVRLERAFAGTVRTAGFNHTWKAALVQRSGVSMGSVFVYTCEGTPSEEGIRQLEAYGVGQRRQEGFGRVLINPELDTESILKIKISDSENEEIAFTEEDRKMLELTAGYINGKRVDTCLKDGALDFSVKQGRALSSISLSQKARLFNLLSAIDSESRYAADQNAKERLLAFADEELKSKSKEKYQKARIKLAAGSSSGQNEYDMWELIREIASDNIEHSRMNPYWEDVKVMSFLGSSPDRPSDFRLNCRFLKEVFYNLMRQEGGR